ncbi:metallophosphoesterase [Paenibacillus terreus]|uniref:metallophosphoesterase n=1 Tax=Paenibacillus terreus TaxID=1387834 RepID=UPI0035CCD8A0
MLNPTENAGRLLVISDIHGHKHGLSLLLSEAAYNPRQDRLILGGDYINDTPDTWDTLETIQALVQSGAQAILGNKETKLMKQPKEKTKTVRTLIDWLNTLPAYIEEDGFLFVHAGFRPGVPLEEQSLKDMTEIREEFWGESDSVADQSGTVIFGHTPTFRMGASPGELWRANRKIGIDTGAKHGCRLTLLDVHAQITYSCSTAADRMYEDLRIQNLSILL